MYKKSRIIVAIISLFIVGGFTQNAWAFQTRNPGKADISLRSDAILIGKIIKIELRKNQLLPPKNNPYSKDLKKRDVTVVTLEISKNEIFKNRFNCLEVTKDTKFPIRRTVLHTLPGKDKQNPEFKINHKIGLCLKKSTTNVYNFIVLGGSEHYRLFDRWTSTKTKKYIVAVKYFKRIASFQAVWSKPVNGMQMGLLLYRGAYVKTCGNVKKLVGPKPLNKNYSVFVGGKFTSKIFYRILIRNTSDKAKTISSPTLKNSWQASKTMGGKVKLWDYSKNGQLYQFRHAFGFAKNSKNENVTLQPGMIITIKGFDTFNRRKPLAIGDEIGKFVLGIKFKAAKKNPDPNDWTGTLQVDYPELVAIKSK